MRLKVSTSPMWLITKVLALLPPPSDPPAMQGAHALHRRDYPMHQHPLHSLNKPQEHMDSTHDYNMYGDGAQGGGGERRPL
jgi:hypothetical protein